MATHADIRASASIPRPLRAAAPLAALAAVALVLDADPRLPWLAGAVTAGLFALAAAGRWLQQRLELHRVRATADRLILQGFERHGAPTIVLWRAEELAADRHRRMLAHEVERVLHAASPSRMPSASPLDRRAVRRSAAVLARLEARLGDERPVSARGMLLAERLLADPESALYNPASAEPLPLALRHVLRELEP